MRFYYSSQFYHSIPAILLHLPEEGEPHDCLASARELAVPPSDVLDIRFENTNLILFADESYLKLEVTRQDVQSLVKDYSPWPVVKSVQMK